MELDIPPQAIVYADGAYNCFDLEDILQDEGIRLMAKRGSKAKNRVRPPAEEKQISSRRQIVETAFSSILHQFPRCIRVGQKTRLSLRFSVLFFPIVFLFYGKARSLRTLWSTPSTALHVLARAGPCLCRVLLYLMHSIAS